MKVVSDLIRAVADASAQGRPSAIRINPSALDTLMEEVKRANALVGFVPHSFQGVELVATSEVEYFEIVP